MGKGLVVFITPLAILTNHYTATMNPRAVEVGAVTTVPSPAVLLTFAVARCPPGLAGLASTFALVLTLLVLGKLAPSISASPSWRGWRGG